ncbi:Phosphatidylinositol 4-kinase gamma 4 (AtPI4Kgamma4) (PI-4Kgamma4) (PI4K gamma 4) (Ubiquitin-like domain kinase gamma 4) (UbDK gamma 4), partial [Durusdinium trenchii]
RIPRAVFSASELSEQLARVDTSQAERAPNGTGGVYFVGADAESRVVFKPAAEENETTHGEGFLKEFAAYAVDSQHAGVPETLISILDVQNEGPRLGAVQTYLAHHEDAEDLGPNLFDTDDVHRIGILDIRIANCDRHSGNLLRHRETGRLRPIDHGTSFPSALLGGLADISSEVFSYPQARQPFSAANLQMIEDIDIDQDLEKVNLIGLDEGAQLTMYMTATILKLGASHGLTLHDIGALVQRQGDRSKPSVLEQVFAQAVTETAAPQSPAESRDFFEAFEACALERIASSM